MLERARGIWAVAFAVAALHVVLATQYGLHRDELYLLQHGKHVFEGSLDHAIATPLLSWATQLVLGDSAVALRVGPALLGGGLVIVAAELCRRLGGDAWAQWIAAGVVASSPVFIYTAGVFGTTAIDQMITATLALAITIVVTSNANRRWWLVIGLVAGIGLANKLVTLLAVFSLAVGLATTPARKWLRTPWPYVAAVIAATFTIPDLVLAPDGPLALFERHHAARLRDVALGDFALGQLADIHVLGLVAVACAIRRARHDPGARVVIVSWLLAGLALVIAHGKHYQWAPWYVAAIAAGAIPIAAWLRERTVPMRRALVAIFAASTIVSWVATLPVLPLPIDAIHRELVQFADWENLVAQIAAARDRAGLARETPVVTDSYGTAAAVERYGSAVGLPPPLSGANSYHLWTRTDRARWELARTTTRVLWIGFPEEVRRSLCREAVPIGEVRFGDRSNRFDFPRVIYRCELRAPVADGWEQLRAFD